MFIINTSIITINLGVVLSESNKFMHCVYDVKIHEYLNREETTILWILVELGMKSMYIVSLCGLAAANTSSVRIILLGCTMEDKGIRVNYPPAKYNGRKKELGLLF